MTPELLHTVLLLGGLCAAQVVLTLAIRRARASRACSFAVIAAARKFNAEFPGSVLVAAPVRRRGKWLIGFFGRGNASNPAFTMPYP